MTIIVQIFGSTLKTDPIFGMEYKGLLFVGEFVF